MFNTVLENHTFLKQIRTKYIFKSRKITNKYYIFRNLTVKDNKVYK
jgi:hypothetical protein